MVSAESMGAVEKCADWDNCSFVGALIEGRGFARERSRRRSKIDGKIDPERNIDPSDSIPSDSALPISRPLGKSAGLLGGD